MQGNAMLPTPFHAPYSTLLHHSDSLRMWHTMILVLGGLSEVHNLQNKGQE
jgi:hypothetical protein